MSAATGMAIGVLPVLALLAACRDPAPPATSAPGAVAPASRTGGETRAPGEGSALVPVQTRPPSRSVILRVVRFVGRTDRFTDQSRSLLTDIAHALRTSPRITEVHLVVAVWGGATEQADIELSRRRAYAWRAALMALGVDGARLHAFGVGRRCRTDSPDALEDRAAARAYIVRTSEGPTGVQWNCLPEPRPRP